MKELTKSSHSASEIIAYHKIKRIFLNVADMDKEDPHQIQICKFNDQDFQLLADVLIINSHNIPARFRY